MKSKLLKTYLYLQYLLLALWVFVAGPLLFIVCMAIYGLAASGGPVEGLLQWQLTVFSWFLLSWGVPLVVSVFSLKATRKLVKEEVLTVFNKIAMGSYVVMYLLFMALGVYAFLELFVFIG